MIKLYYKKTSFSTILFEGEEIMVDGVTKIKVIGGSCFRKNNSLKEGFISWDGHPFFFAKRDSRPISSLDPHSSIYEKLKTV